MTLEASRGEHPLNSAMASPLQVVTRMHNLSLMHRLIVHVSLCDEYLALLNQMLLLSIFCYFLICQLCCI